jgi:hypothetical protein
MSVNKTYDIGDKVTLKATFKNTSCVIADPTAVSIKIREPDGSENSYSPLKVDTGIYSYDLTFDAHGVWYYRWIGTGAVHTAGEGRIVVRKSDFDTP